MSAVRGGGNRRLSKRGIQTDVVDVATDESSTAEDAPQTDVPRRARSVSHIISVRVFFFTQIPPPMKSYFNAIFLNWTTLRKNLRRCAIRCCFRFKKDYIYVIIFVFVVFRFVDMFVLTRFLMVWSSRVFRSRSPVIIITRNDCHVHRLSPVVNINILTFDNTWCIRTNRKFKCQNFDVIFGVSWK